MRASDEPVTLPTPMPPGGPAAPAGLPLIRAALVLAVGLPAGLGATRVVLDRELDPGTRRIGAWSTLPGVGTMNIDPYARAILARTGEVPLPAAEGVVFTARVDSGGRPLSASCWYTVEGPVPPARYWTLSVTDTAGRAIENAAGRYGFASTAVLRGFDGGFAVEVSPNARPGNWLPIRGPGPFVLSLRVYDSPLGGNAAISYASGLPAITRRTCGTP